MSFYHGQHRERSYFEGWYFKQQANGRTLAVIPGISMAADGSKTAFIQVITESASHFVAYPFSAFEARRSPLGVRIGQSVFTAEGLFLDIREPDLTLRGKLHYGELTPLESDIMGPFRSMPLMECRHRVISMRHTVQGRLNYQGETLVFDGGVGYMEMDWGTSFPRSYLWTQCSAPEEDCSVMVSIADVPFLGRSFRGCIAAVRYQGREIRLAIYHGVKIRRYSGNGLILQQGKHCLKVEADPDKAQDLKAPSGGHMSRVIRESAACPARYRLYEDYRLLFDLRAQDASFEAVDYDE